MTRRCKRRARLLTVAVTAGGNLETLTIPASCSEFVIQARTAVGVQVRLSAGSADYFSLAAGAAYTESDLALDDELTLHFEASADVVIEAWLWEG